MGLDLEYGHGQTPLDEDEKEGLAIPMITTRAELDEHEQLNIEEAVQWTMRNRFGRKELLTEGFIRKLHARMYGHVWKWAGEFRRSEKNIGIHWFDIPVELRKLLDDCQYWIDEGKFPPDEIAIRFKHRLVSIHCFANGNGRHARLIADLIAERIFHRPIFTWGGQAAFGPGEARKKYIESLHQADLGDIRLLMEFARS